jgi:hypothetical protein
MVRFLVDPNLPHQLIGTILDIPQGEPLSFQNEQDFIRQIYILLENQDAKPGEQQEHVDTLKSE